MVMGGQRHARGALLAGWASVLLVLVTPLSRANTQQPLIPPRATVILLSGLPGDVESENSYQDQLQSWMQTVENDGKADRLFVLCDNPQALKLPVKLKVERLRSDRENFLAVGQK